MLLLQQCKGQRGEHQQHEQRQADHAAVTAVGLFFHAENVADSVEQRLRRRGGGGQDGLHVRSFHLTELFQSGQGFCVKQGIGSVPPHDEFVAQVLAVFVDRLRHVPQQGMVKQERFDEQLHEIRQVIVPPDMSQLVDENDLDLLRREAGKETHRHQHRRTEQADQHRRVDGPRNEQRDAAPDLQTAAEFGESGVPVGHAVEDRQRPAGTTQLCYAKQPERETE